MNKDKDNGFFNDEKLIAELTERRRKYREQKKLQEPEAPPQEKQTSPPRPKFTRQAPQEKKPPEAQKPADKPEPEEHLSYFDPKEIARQIIRDTLKPLMAHIEDNMPEKGESLFKETRKAVREFDRRITHNLSLEINKQLRGSYPEFFTKAGDRFPTKWMVGKPGRAKIKERLKNPIDTIHRAIKLLNSLLDHHTISDEDKSIELAARIGAGKFQKIETRTIKDSQGSKTIKTLKREYNYAFIDPQLDFKDLQKELGGEGFSPSEVKDQYMKEFSSKKVHFLEKFRKGGPHGQMVYASGYLVPTGWGGARVEPFIYKTKEYIAAWERFTLPRERLRKRKRKSQNF